MRTVDDFISTHLSNLFYINLAVKTFFISEVVPVFYSFVYSFDLIFSSNLVDNLLGSKYLDIYTWYINVVDPDYAASVAHLKDIDGKANPYYIPHHQYIQEIVSHPAWLLNPDMVLIHIICRTYNINLSFNFFAFVPAEVSSVITKTMAVIGILMMYYTIIFLAYMAWVALVYFITSSFRDENEVDTSVSSSQFLVECEKEITNLDDMFVPTLLFCFIYGWFFLASFFTFFIMNSWASTIFFALPLLLLTVIGMPMNIIYDYGLMFAAYLRGAGATTILALELMYDCLATMIMFVRLCVQNIRFFLMFFAFVELFELIYNSGLVKWETLESEEDYYQGVLSRLETDGLLYGLVAEFPTFLFRYLYQFGHLLFTLVSHFIAYLALVFWLFSFLYTCFIDERFEAYYQAKRDSWRKRLNLK